MTSINKSIVPDSHVLLADAAGPSLYIIWKLAAPNLSSVLILIKGPSNLISTKPVSDQFSGITRLAEKPVGGMNKWFSRFIENFLGSALDA